MVCSTTWPRRWTFAGSRGGRWVALARRTSCPKLNTCVGWAGRPASSWVSATTRTSTPLGSVRSTVSPPMLSGSFSTFAPVASAEPHHVGGVRGPEGRAEVPRAGPAAHDHARRAGVGPAQLELVRRPAHGG